MQNCCRSHLFSSKNWSSKENFTMIWAIVTLNAPQIIKTNVWVVDLDGDSETRALDDVISTIRLYPELRDGRNRGCTLCSNRLTAVFLQSACVSDVSLWNISTAPPINNPPCAPPENPENGYLLPIYGPQDKLIAVRYKCYLPFTLIGSHQRVCQRDATWSGEVPTCVKGDFYPNRGLPGLPLHVYSYRMHLWECSQALINIFLQVR